MIGAIREWIDGRGKIPFWARWIWPWAHFCDEMDGLLALTKRDLRVNCFCQIHDEHFPKRDWTHHENEDFL